MSGIKIIAYDFSKAFDTLSHRLIVSALRDQAFPKDFIQWTEDYLTGRTQATRVGCVTSEVRSVSSGVPQGSVLGPMLFCLVVGRLKPSSSRTCLIQYIDDTTICISLYKSDTGHVISEHANIIRWSQTMVLKLTLASASPSAI